MKRDHIVGLILFVIGILAVILIQQFPVLEASSDPGPRLFPYIGSVGIILCSIGIFFRKNQGNEEDIVSKATVIKSLFLIGILVVYGFSLEFLGFLISTPIFLFILITLFSNDKKSYVKATAISLLISFLLYFIFQNFLNIILPSGHFY